MAAQMVGDTQLEQVFEGEDTVVRFREGAHEGVERLVHAQ